MNPALAGVAVGRLVMGPTDVLRSAPEGGLLLLNALRVVGGGAIALPHSSGDDRADTSPPRSRRARTGGSSWDFDRSPRPGTSRSSAREEHDRSGARR